MDIITKILNKVNFELLSRNLIEEMNTVKKSRPLRVKERQYFLRLLDHPPKIIIFSNFQS